MPACDFPAHSLHQLVICLLAAFFSSAHEHCVFSSSQLIPILQFLICSARSSGTRELDPHCHVASLQLGLSCHDFEGIGHWPRAQLVAVADWGLLEHKTWVHECEWKRTVQAGVPGPDGILQPPCPWGAQNLKWSGTKIMNSIANGL